MRSEEVHDKSLDFLVSLITCESVCLSMEKANQAYPRLELTFQKEKDYRPVKKKSV